MNTFAIKVAASTLVLSAATMSCGFETIGLLPSANAATTDTDRQASRLHHDARTAIQSGDMPRALALMEQAVALAPRDAGYRMLLADVYLKSGRFQSAEQTYQDVVELHPDNARAGLSLALTRIANGRAEGALGVLDQLNGHAAPADLGLAYALAGLPERAIEIMEPVARTHSATARLRQNLALSYALKGDWARARTVAAQDISPADLPARMEQWAAMARPNTPGQQVAVILGVRPVEDAGQPQRLALHSPAPVPAPVAAEPEVRTAQAQGVWAPAESVAAPVQAAAPVQIAAVEPVAIPASAPVAETPEPQVQQVRYAAAAETLVTPDAAVIRTAAPAVKAVSRPRFSAPVRRLSADNGPGRFAVQLGAFSSAANAERAWQQVERRFGLASEQPLTTTIDMNGRTLHRVSLAGFQSHGDASALCTRIRAQGGACFVRAVAGDAAVRWAMRYGPNRRA